MAKKPKKVLWHSNAPFVPSGYGNQTDLFTSLLAKDGYDVYVSAFYGLKGSKIRANNITILPGSADGWGNDIISAHYENLQPDIFFALMDSWVLDPKQIMDKPLALWYPVDHATLPPSVANTLHVTQFPIAMSRHGEMASRKEGIDPFYIPHGVDTNLYRPVERAKARQHFRIEEDTFVVVMNAANKGAPSRKSFEAVIKAWGIFIRRHPKSVLYLHTMVNSSHGLDLNEIAKFYNIPPETISFPNPYEYSQGVFTGDMLRDMYNMADVFLSPSQGEGFGIPVMEAQACGCPTIVSDFTAQSELGSYIKIPVTETWYTLQRAEQAIIKVEDIVTALEQAYAEREDTLIRKQARTFAMDYDVRRVYTKYMKPVFEFLQLFR